MNVSPRCKRVVIVGGGLAGLSAAETLARGFGERFSVTVLEGKRIVGGRAGSFTDPASGETVDYCQHVAMGCCTNLIGLLDRCGLGDQMHRYTELEFHHPEHRPSRFAASRFLPPPLHLAGAIGSLRYLSAVEKRGIKKALLRLLRTPSDALAEQTAADWLLDQQQQPGAISRFWDVVLVSALGEKTDVVSMAAARKVFVDGFAAARGSSDVLVPKIALSALFGDRLRKQIGELGVTIATGAVVTKVDSTDPNQVVVETSDGRRFATDHLILAVPWHSVGALLSQTELSAEPVPRFPSSPISGVHLWFDREIHDQPHAVLVGTLAQWLFRQPFRGEASQTSETLARESLTDETSPKRSDPAGHYYQVVISASAEQRGMPKEQLVERLLDELRDVFPRAKQAKLLHSRVVTDPHSVFSLSPEVERARPPSRTALPWLHLAGDWIATGWPSTMEGAVISGRMAVASVSASERLDGVEIDAGLPRGWLARWLIAP